LKQFQQLDDDREKSSVRAGLAHRFIGEDSIDAIFVHTTFVL
jgi:hypothetical protein